MTHATTRTFSPRQLRARPDLVDGLHAAHCAIFAGVDRAAFEQHVLDSPAERTRIQLVFGSNDRVVGYTAVHFFRGRRLGDDNATVMRCETGLLPEYRRRGLGAPFLIREVLAERLRAPLTRLLGFASLVHPSSFVALHRYVDGVWPQPGTVTPQTERELMGSLADEFGLKVRCESAPMIRKVGWITLEKAYQKTHWQRSAHPAARLFLSMNPGYSQGDGLLTLVPVNLATITQAAARWVARKLTPKPIARPALSS